jgi:hypothetical protein
MEHAAISGHGLIASQAARALRSRLDSIIVVGALPALLFMRF